jgi:excinuclease UvrABC nuclease subunit
MTKCTSWTQLGLLSELTSDFSAYNADIGLYRAILNEEIVYIGKATELNNGGFRKRLRDYTRRSESARNYTAGRLMHSHMDEIYIHILIFERTSESISKINEAEAALIQQLKPKWNIL